MRRVRRSTAIRSAGVSTTFNAVRERSAVKVARCVLWGPRFREEAWLPSYGGSWARGLKAVEVLAENLIVEVGN